MIKIIFQILMICIFSSVVFSYPDIDFTENSFSSGKVDIRGKASVGFEISLYINSQYVSKQNIALDALRVDLEDNLLDINAAIYQNIIIKNSGSSQIKLNFSSESGDLSEMYFLLNVGQSYDFSYSSAGSLKYRDMNNPGTTKQVVIHDDYMDNFSFLNVQDYLKEGSNEIKFVLIPISGGESTEKTFTVDYKKFSNIINLDSYEEIINLNEITLSGFVQDSLSPLGFVINVEGNIGNIGLLDPIELDGNKFSFTASKLKEGNNSIRIISVDKENPTIFNGETIANVFVDTLPPEINVISVIFKPKNSDEEETWGLSEFEEGIYLNSKSISFNISVSATELNFEFNNKNGTCPNIENDSVLCTFSLVSG
ncbi:hypothetical protein EOM09_06400, partial [bacterium]|nr:hypothetical protein [bacterium]